VTTGWVSMANFHSMCALLQTGVLGASATVDAKLQQATGLDRHRRQGHQRQVDHPDRQGLWRQQAGTIEVRDTDIDANNGFQYVRLSVTVGTAASILGATLLGTNPMLRAGLRKQPGRRRPAGLIDRAPVIGW
jgi:hypothetical protein